MARVYVNYPRYVVTGRFLNSFSTDLPLFFFSIFIGKAFTGSFAFAIAILGLSYSVLGTAVLPVFLQKANSLFHENERLVGPFVLKVYYGLFALSVLPFTILAVFGDLIFPFVFGDAWSEAGRLVRFLSYYTLFRLIISPLTAVFRIYTREDLGLKFNIILFVTRAIMLILGFQIFGGIGSVIAFSLGNIGVFVLVSIWVFKLSNVTIVRPIFTVFTLTAICYIIVSQLRFIFL